MEAGRNLCLVCGRKGSHSVVVTSEHAFVTASGTSLSDFLCKVVGEEPCYSVSESLCQQCYILLDRLDAYQARAKEIHTHISNRYRDTKLELIGHRQRLSELIASSLTNVHQLQHGTTLNVSDELSITIVHEALPKKKKVSTSFENYFSKNPGHRFDTSWPPEFREKISRKRKRSEKKSRLLYSTVTSSLNNNIINSNINNNINNINNNNNNISKNDIQRHFKTTKKKIRLSSLERAQSRKGHTWSAHKSLYRFTERRPDGGGGGGGDGDEGVVGIGRRIEVGSREVEEEGGGDEDVEKECVENEEEEFEHESGELENGRNGEEDEDDTRLESDRGTKERIQEERQNAVGSAERRSARIMTAAQGQVAAAQEALMQSPIAATLLQSFLSTSLWFGPTDSDSNSKSPNKDKNKEIGDEVTSETLAAAAGCTKDKKKRQELKNTGQSYVNTKGKLVEAKRVWPQDCSRCPWKCNAHINEEERLEIFAEYWGLADYLKQRNYLASHMQREERLGPSGQRRTVVLYFLSLRNKRKQVCRQFFLKTLDVSEKASRIVLEKKMRGELGTESEIAAAAANKDPDIDTQDDEISNHSQ
ncbi:uncharacterized protein LOC143038671 isoform X2 [Oratosquilla oratoria]|uniref:uncharacterized protein LOC143038671 isoform X2 n=1 Tax=Oratosquilla oratoria TaxID=337810 RepID=UPI003F75B185